MKKLLISTIIALAPACTESPDRTPALPDDRPATLEEAIGAILPLVLTYDPADSPPPAWAAWQGLAELRLGAPDVGLDYLPARLILSEGFDHLDDCLPNSVSASWTLDGAGLLVVETIPGPGEARLRLEGPLTMHHEYDGEDDERQDPLPISFLVASGTWSAVPGADCGPDDFAGGLEGLWQTVRPESAEQEEAAPAEPQAHLLIVTPSGTRRISGPRSRILAIAAEVAQ